MSIKVERQVFPIKSVDDYSKNKASINKLLDDLYEIALNHFYPEWKVKLYLTVDGGLSDTYIPFYTFGVFEFTVDTMYLLLQNDKQGQIDVISEFIKSGVSNYINHIVGGTWWEHIEKYDRSEYITGICAYDDIPKDKYINLLIEQLNYRNPNSGDVVVVPEEIQNDMFYRLDDILATKLISDNRLRPRRFGELIPKSIREKIELDGRFKKKDSLLFTNKSQWESEMKKELSKTDFNGSIDEILESKIDNFGGNLATLIKKGIVLNYL